jgi:two-component system sensor histidine kinase KdpD
VDDIIATALVRAKNTTKAHNIELQIERELPVVRVDERAVSEVMYILIENAAKYSPQGTTIRIVASRSAEGVIRMAVEDEGVGIPIHLRKRVFDKFFRAIRDGDVATGEPSGTGMGLAIAKGIIEAHGGDIWIEPASDHKGTRVVFTLPVGDDEAELTRGTSQRVTMAK